MAVQVITYAPTGFYHCRHCELTFQHVGIGPRVHAEQMREALPPDLMEQFHAVAGWAAGLVERFGPRVRVSVVDAASIEGVWKSLRHGVRTYPAVIVAGGEKYTGADFAGAEAALERHLAAAGEAGETGEKGEKGER